MRIIAVGALVFVCALSGAQRIPDAVFAEGKSEFISVQSLTSDGRSAVITFFARTRNACLELLHQLHQVDQFEYEVSWGDTSTVTVWAPVDSTNPEDDPEIAIETAYRRVLGLVGMTYRITGGMYRPVIWYSRYFEPIEVKGTHGSMDLATGEVNSLDVLAAALAAQGVGYRVERARGKTVSILAQNCPLSVLAGVLQTLDDGIVIDQTLGIVVRSRKKVLGG